MNFKELSIAYGISSSYSLFTRDTQKYFVTLQSMTKHRFNALKRSYINLKIMEFICLSHEESNIFIEED